MKHYALHSPIGTAQPNMDRTQMQTQAVSPNSHNEDDAQGTERLEFINVTVKFTPRKSVVKLCIVLKCYRRMKRKICLRIWILVISLTKCRLSNDPRNSSQVRR